MRVAEALQRGNDGATKELNPYRIVLTTRDVGRFPERAGVQIPEVVDREVVPGSGDFELANHGRLA